MVESWVLIKEAASILNKPERTLRLYASQGKIKTKKQGKYWLFEVSRYAKNGEAPGGTSSPPAQATEQPAALAAGGRPVDVQTDGPQTASANSGRRRDRKYSRLEDLGVYKDLYWTLSTAVGGGANEINQGLKRAAVNLAQGFYEYEYGRKIEKFKICRDCLAETIVEASLQSDPGASEIRSFLESNVMPGLSGLIRKIEKKRK